MSNANKTTQDGASNDVHFDAAKKVSDDSLLSALSLVIKANVEYAKGVTDLIACDLEREDKLTEIKDELRLLVTKTELLISSQENLLRAISIKEITSEQYLDKKLTPLYRGVGLRDDGSEHTPADKWVVKLQNALQSRLFMIIAGAIIFWIGKLLLAGIADKVTK